MLSLTLPAPAEIVRFNFDGWAIPVSSDYQLVCLTHVCGYYQRRPAEFFAEPLTRVMTMLFLAQFEKGGPIADITFAASDPSGEEWTHCVMALECARWLDPRLYVELGLFITRGLARRTLPALSLPSLAVHPAMQKLVEHLAPCGKPLWKPRELFDLIRLLGVTVAPSKSSRASNDSSLGKMFTSAVGTVFVVNDRRFLWSAEGKGNQRRYSLRSVDA